MFDPASPQIENLFLSTLGTGIRALCVTGCSPDSGVTSIATCLATRAAMTERRTLLLDISQDICEVDTDCAPPVAKANPSVRSLTNALTYEKKTLSISRDRLFHYRDKTKLGAYIADQLRHFDVLIIDAAPSCDMPAKAVPGMIAAGASEATVVVAPGGRATANELGHTMKALTTVGATVIGLIVNNRDNPDPRQEIRRTTNRIRQVFARKQKRSDRKAAAGVPAMIRESAA